MRGGTYVKVCEKWNVQMLMRDVVLVVHNYVIVETVNGLASKPVQHVQIRNQHSMHVYMTCRWNMVQMSRKVTVDSATSL